MMKNINRPLRVFLSHASEDKSAVRALRNLLGGKNVDVWLDEERILPGQSWENEIRKGLEDADIVLVCLSKRLVNKEGYIQRELRMALKKAEEKPEDTIYLIPLKLEECDPPSTFEHLQWANLFFKDGKFENSIVNRILLSLRKRAESLGIEWDSIFPNPEQPSTISEQSDNTTVYQISRLPKTIQIEMDARGIVPHQMIGDRHDQVSQTPIAVFRDRNLEASTIKNNAALVIYLVDVSGTMGKSLRGKTRLDFVRSALRGAVEEMVIKSTEGGKVLPKYRVALYTYSNEVVDVLNGVKTIEELVTIGLPKFQLMNKTETAIAFAEAEKLLRLELPDMQDAPVPLICHITDGKFTGENPIPFAQRIMKMSVKQGNVLIENIFICDDMLAKPIEEIRSWHGVSEKSELQNEYAHSLFDMSSRISENYLKILSQNGYDFSANAKLLIPGEFANDFIKLIIP